MLSMTMLKEGSIAPVWAGGHRSKGGLLQWHSGRDLHLLLLQPPTAKGNPSTGFNPSVQIEFV